MDIMREIQRLRIEQEQHAKTSPSVVAAAAAGQQRNPTLLAELRLLRQRRDELEARMSALQESRRELMVQLESLMKLLKSHSSPRSTPNSSPRSRNATSPPLPLARGSSAPSTPGDPLSGVGGDVKQAFGAAGAAGSVHSLRNDLLVAADSVTNAMSSLVKELNSEASSGSEGEDGDCDQVPGNGVLGEDLAAWQAELQHRLQKEGDFIRELRARKSQTMRSRGGSSSANDQYMMTDDGESYIRTDDESFLTTDDGESYVKTDDESCMRTDEEDAELYDQDPKDLLPQRYTTDEESCLETDQESYIRTDDEEGGSTEWEDAMRRWVNR